MVHFDGINSLSDVERFLTNFNIYWLIWTSCHRSFVLMGGLSRWQILQRMVVWDLSWGRFGGWLRCSNIYGGRRWGISREAALETFCNIRRVPK